MKWEGRAESSNVEDRRGIRPGAAVGGVGTVVVFVVAMLFGFDPQEAIQIATSTGGTSGQTVQQPIDPSQDRQAAFTKVVLRDTEVVWDNLFRQLGQQYPQPKLVLFSGAVESACGLADVAVGPFYCPADAQVYIDLSFYEDMQKELNSPGEFARAYVIAHEVGHHVQHVLGYSDEAEGKRRGKKRANQATVRLELQADFLAGIWAHHGQKRFKFLEPGDIESALGAAFEIGDDRLQKKSQGYVVPDSFTHGTSKQRQRWFMEGFERGDVNAARQLLDLRYEEL